MPLPILLVFADHHVADAGDVATFYRSLVLRGPCFLINVAVQDSTSALTTWDCVIHKEGDLADFMSSITLFQRELQRGIARDIIWEGRRYIPRGWILDIVAYDLVLNDVLSIHGGYESVEER